MNLSDVGYVGKLVSTIRAEATNGYHGKVLVYDRFFTKRYELLVYDFRGHLVFHSFAGNVKTKEALQEFVNGFPEFRREMGGGK